MLAYRSLSALAFVGLLAGCGGGGSTGGSAASPSTSSVSTALVDGPFRSSGGTVSAVNVTIAKVTLVGGGAPQVLATFSPSKSINLLDYQTTALQFGTAQIPPGQYQQLRLVLDTSSANNTSVVINGTSYPLTIPSATGGGFGNATSTDNGDGVGTSGIKVNVALNAQAGQSYGFLIDFNAAESIVKAGANYLMKPVLVATAQSQSGSIAGTVKNKAGTAVSDAEVLAQQNGVTVNSGVTDANGAFQINALPVGSYTLVVKNQWTSQAGSAETATGADGTADVTVSPAVNVTLGATTTVAITD